MQIEPGFHAHDGWFFLRLADGSVRIRQHVAPDWDRGAPVAEITLDPASWASIVCSVSAQGEDGTRWNAAQDFHGRT